MTESENAGRGAVSLEKGLVSIVVGLIVAVLVIMALEPVLQRLYPGADLTRPALEAGEPLPLLSSLLLLGAYAISSFVGGLGSSLISGGRESWPAGVTALGLMIAGSYGVMAIRPPVWFWVASLLTYAAAYLGHLLARSARR